MASGEIAGTQGIKCRQSEMYHATEARHRLLVWTGMVLLLVLSLTPATGQPALAADPLLDRCREILSQCFLALRAVGAPLRWTPLAILVGGLFFALFDRIRLSAKVCCLLRRQVFRLPGSGDSVADLAAELHCLSKVRLIVGTAPNPAFTAGLCRPRIYLDERLQETLTPAELRAVLRHELHHVRRHDPLRFAALRFVAKTLFWLPLAEVLVNDLMEDAEVLADDFAAAQADGSDPLDVASALVKIGRANAKVVAGIAALDGGRLLDRRVRRLANEPASAFMSLPLRQSLVSAVALLILWGFATVAPRSVNAAMTMRLGDPCPHVMHVTHSKCPECDNKPLDQMPGCDN